MYEFVICRIIFFTGCPKNVHFETSLFQKYEI
jgi:hypothetical protein